MEPTVSLDANALKLLIKESVREVMREEWFKFFELLIPYVDDEEQGEIEASFTPADHPGSDFVDITDWFGDADQAQIARAVGCIAPRGAAPPTAKLMHRST